MQSIKGTLPQIIATLGALLSEFDLTKVYVCQIKLWRERRSLNANAYYWKLLGEYADWARKSKNRLHNEMLARYGQEFRVDELCAYTVIPDTDNYLELSAIHLKPTSQIKYSEDGRQFRTFKLLRGSHEYDSREMAILIDGLIQEIQGSEAPIQVMTPDELERMNGYARISQI